LIKTCKSILEIFYQVNPKITRNWSLTQVFSQSEVDSKIRNDLEVGLYEEGSKDFYAAWDDEVDKAKNKSLKKYLEQEIQNLPFNAVTRLHPFSNFY